MDVERNAVSRLDAKLYQAIRHLVGALVELAIRRTLIVEDNRGLIGILAAVCASIWPRSIALLSSLKLNSEPQSSDFRRISRKKLTWKGYQRDPRRIVDNLAVDVAGVLRCEECDDAGDLAGLPNAAERDASRRGGLGLRRQSQTLGGGAVMSVSMKPGATAFAVIPNGPSSMARVRVSPWMPAFAAE